MPELSVDKTKAEKTISDIREQIHKLRNPLYEANNFISSFLGSIDALEELLSKAEGAVQQFDKIGILLGLFAEGKEKGK